MSDPGDCPAEDALDSPDSVPIEVSSLVRTMENNLHQSEAEQSDEADADQQGQNHWNSLQSSEQGYSTSGGESGTSFPTTDLIGLEETFTSDPLSEHTTESILEPTPLTDIQSSHNRMLFQMTLAHYQQQPPAQLEQQQIQQRPQHGMIANNVFLPGGLDFGGFLQGTMFSQSQIPVGQVYGFYPGDGQSHMERMPMQNHPYLQQVQPLFGGGFGFSNQEQVGPQIAQFQNPGVASFAAGASFPSGTVADTNPSARAVTLGRQKRKYDHESFPEKLHRLILESHVNGKTHIIRFTPDGASFEVLHTKNFEAEILPHYFRHNKATSFKRVLRMYGFSRVKGTWLQGTFEHPLFHRNFPEMCKQMQRLESPGAAEGRKKKSDAS